MKPRDLRAALLAALAGALVWIVVLAGAHEAFGAPGDRIVSETREWIEQTTRSDVQDRTMVVVENFDRHGPEFSGENAPFAVVPWPGSTMEVRADLAWALVQLEQGDRSRGRVAGMVLLHELLHRAEHFHGDRRMEEGVTQARAWDLYPAWSWRFRGVRVQSFEDAYGWSDEEYVDRVRGASRFATGSRSWTTPAARRWRADLWAASPEGRLSMMAAAAAARDAGRSVR